MKKFLLFIIAFASHISWGQDNIPSVNNYTEISSNYRAELGSGNFVYNIPLFDIATLNPEFNFRGNLYYNAQAASSVYTADGIIARGWSADFLPSIYRKIEEAGTFWDESYHRVNSAEVYGDGEPYEKPERTNDLFQINIFGLTASFRLQYHDNNSITVDLVDSNSYIEITPGYSMSSGAGDAKIINISGFTVKDGNGYTYAFNEPEESLIRQTYGPLSPFVDLRHEALDNPNGYNPYKRAFLLSGVTDKYGRSLLQYSYKTTLVSQTDAGVTVTYNNKAIDLIDVVNKAKLVFVSSTSTVSGVSVNDYKGQLIKRAGFTAGAVRFYDQNNQEAENYLLLYNPSASASFVNSYGNYLKTGDCLDPEKESWTYYNNVQDYSAGLLKTIILPQKGKIDIEYETNTYTLANLGHQMNQLNYEYVEVPVTYNSSTTNYSFPYGTVTIGTGEAYYLQFNSTVYTDPLLTDENGNPLRIYPGFEIFSTGSNPVLLQGFPYANQCEYGEKIDHNGLYTNSTVVLRRKGGTPANVSNVKVYRKTLKPESERINYCFGPSVRVKKITNTNHTGTLLNEKSYSYQDPADDKISSGTIWDMRWYLSSKYLIPVFYKYITEEETGKGKTVYQMNMDPSVVTAEAKEINYHTKNIWKYNEAGQLTEHVNNEFEYYRVSDNDESEDRIKKINSVLKSYEGTAFKTTTTEKVLDTVSMLPLYNKITEESIGQTFIEQYTNQKLGNAFYRTAVEKTKNSAALNKSTFTYQQQGTTQAYNLKTVSVAKENRPLEVEKEVTLTDNYGNVLEYKTKEGLVVSQVWGYNDSQVVAELKNVAYADIAAATLTTIKTHSAGTTFNEANLITALSSLRNAHGAGYVTTYTYKPLVGISTVTDANGRKESYVYDDFNRLYRVLNHEGLVIKEYNYNIRPY